MSGREELLEAVRSGDDAAVRALVEEDPALAAVRDDDGISAVLNAHYRMRPDTVDILLAADPELDVFEAAALGRADRVAELLDADPGLMAAWSRDGFTPLHLAAFFGYQEAAALLLERGSDVGLHARNPMAVTPLHSAAAGSRHAVAELLLEHGAEVDARQQGGWTPLHSASDNGDARMAELLLSYGADPGVLNGEGKRPRDLATASGGVEVLELLRARDA